VVSGYAVLKFFSLWNHCAKAIEDSTVMYVPHPSTWTSDRRQGVYDVLTESARPSWMPFETFDAEVGSAIRRVAQLRHIAASQRPEVWENRAQGQKRRFEDPDQGEQAADRFLSLRATEEGWSKWYEAILDSFADPQRRADRLSARRETLEARTDEEKSATAELKSRLAQEMWRDPELRSRMSQGMRDAWIMNKEERVAQTLSTLGPEGLQQRGKSISSGLQELFRNDPSRGANQNKRLNDARLAKKAAKEAAEGLTPERKIELKREKNRLKSSAFRAKRAQAKAAAGVKSGRSSEATLERMQDPSVRAKREKQLGKAREANRKRILSQSAEVVSARLTERKTRKAEVRKARASGSEPPPARAGSAAALRAKQPEDLTHAEKLHLDRLNRIKLRAAQKKIAAASSAGASSSTEPPPVDA
jgi:hypothetical protein